MVVGHDCWNGITWCCRIFCESIVSGRQDMPTSYSCSTAYSAAACFPSMCSSLKHAVTSEQLETQMETEQPQFKYWAPVLDFKCCVLRLGHSVRCGEYHPCMLSPTNRMPWRFALDSVNYSIHIRKI